MNYAQQQNAALTAGQTLGPSAYASHDPKPISELQMLVDHQESGVNIFAEGCARLEAALDRIQGGRPQEVNKSAGSPVAGNPLARLRAGNEAVSALGQRLHDLVNRLETIG